MYKLDVCFSMFYVAEGDFMSQTSVHQPQWAMAGFGKDDFIS